MFNLLVGGMLHAVGISSFAFVCFVFLYFCILKKKTMLNLPVGGMLHVVGIVEKTGEIHLVSLLPRGMFRVKNSNRDGTREK